MVTVEHWRGLVVKEGESQPDASQCVKEEGEGEQGGQEEEQQGVLHQVGGHGAHDKAQAMQVNFLIQGIGWMKSKFYGESLVTMYWK